MVATTEEDDDGANPTMGVGAVVARRQTMADAIRELMFWLGIFVMLMIVIGECANSARDYICVLSCSMLLQLLVFYSLSLFLTSLLIRSR